MDAAIPLIVCLLAFLAGYARGDYVTSRVYEARVASINAAHAEQERARAEAVAAAEKNARERLAAETARGEKFARELAVKTAELDAERASVNRRIRDVSEAARRDCAGLSDGWVRLYNEALGLAPAAPEASAPAAGIGAPAGSASATGAGVRSGASVMVSPEDLLAHARDYGGYCRNLRAQAEALLAVEKGREGRP